jgi:simple sugar transport system ATP-binding protein
MRKISKTFPGGVVAVDGINLDLRAGEIHALLGENGAGKTTLMNMLYGYWQPDEGAIYFLGEKASLRSPRDAINLGIGMVHQHFTFIPNLTVTENVILGQEIKKGPFLDMERSRKKVTELSQKYGLQIDPDARMDELSAGEKQRVEILKALYRDAQILILDEPTVSLTPREIDDLMDTLRTSVKKGNITVPFITHKLPIALGISDRITVLRKGKVIDTVDAADATEGSLAKMMVGKEVLFDVEKEDVERGREILRVENLSAIDDRGYQALKGVSFSLYEGEILGIAGVSGNGQNELVKTIMGLEKATEGRVIALGKDITNDSTDEIIRHAVGYIAEDRKSEGSIDGFSIAKNLILNIQTLSQFTNNLPTPFKGGRSIMWDRVRKNAERLISEYNIVCPGQDTLARNLSGGNLQKCILAREMDRNPKILIAHNPSKGLDVGAIEFVRKRLIEQRKKKVGIILISEDLSEIMSMSDRIAVMNEGRIVGIVHGKEATWEDLGLMMSGAKEHRLVS